jgi:hypothetical protein
MRSATVSPDRLFQPLRVNQAQERFLCKRQQTFPKPRKTPPPAGCPRQTLTRGNRLTFYLLSAFAGAWRLGGLGASNLDHHTIFSGVAHALGPAFRKAREQSHQGKHQSTLPTVDLSNPHAQRVRASRATRGEERQHT